MSPSVRSFFSASIGPGLTLFTACSAAYYGPLALVTTVSFIVTVLYGIIEIALLSYTPIDSIELNGPSLLIDDSLEENASADRDSAILEFPSAREHTSRAA